MIKLIFVQLKCDLINEINKKNLNYKLQHTKMYSLPKFIEF